MEARTPVSAWALPWGSSLQADSILVWIPYCLISAGRPIRTHQAREKRLFPLYLGTMMPSEQGGSLSFTPSLGCMGVIWAPALAPGCKRIQAPPRGRVWGEEETQRCHG